MSDPKSLDVFPKDVYLKNITGFNFLVFCVNEKDIFQIKII